MKDVELYKHLLGLTPPWAPVRVQVAPKDATVDVWVAHPGEERFPCPECGTVGPVYDHTPERTWRHLDSCQFKTLLHASIPRVDCGTHGVRQVHIPWAEPGARFTALFERFAIDVLAECSVAGAAKLLRISWDEAWGIQDRAVSRGLMRKHAEPHPVLGVDEKSVLKGHRYFTIVSDLQRGTVESVSFERRQTSLDDYYASLTQEQRDGVQAVAMDMWDPFVRSTQAYVPQAEIVFDRYHIMTHMGAAVDDVRKWEHRQLMERGESLLKGTKYWWLYGEENLPDRYRESFQQLKNLNLKTARAWGIKETLRALWGFATREGAKLHWKGWYFWATHSRLEPVKKVAAMLKRRLSQVLSYFKYRITNATAEGLNSKIQTIKKKAYGYRNLKNFKTAIYFHCGGLSLYPDTAAVKLFTRPQPTDGRARLPQNSR